MVGNLGWPGCGVEHHDPGLVAGLQCDVVADGVAADFQVAGHAVGILGAEDVAQPGHTQPPFPPVKIAQHRSAKVQLAGVGWFAFKPQPECNGRVLCQVGHTAHLHAGRQASATRQAVSRYTPQGRYAWKQHKQHHHDGRTHHRHAACRARCRPQRGLAHRHVRHHQRRQQSPHRQQNARCREQTLRIQKMREQREQAQKKHHKRVAPRTQLQRFERQHDHDQRDACLLTQQRAVGHECGGRCPRHQQHQPPA